MLWYEAVDQLKAGRVLTAPSRTRWARTGGMVRLKIDAVAGWRLEDDSADTVCSVANFERLELALLEFERRVGQVGLINAVSANRYAFLFPNGSSLGWNEQARKRWQIQRLPFRMSRLRKVG